MVESAQAMLENVTNDQWLFFWLSIAASWLLGLGFHRLAARRHRILYDYDSDAIALEVHHSDIEYRFEGKIVPSLYRTQLCIRSFGNSIIEPNELSSNGALDFFVGENCILRAFLWDGQVHSNAALEVSKNRSAISIKVERIGPGDSFRTVIFSNKPLATSFECRTYVLGKPRSIRRVRPIRDSMFLGIVLITPALVALMLSISTGSSWVFESLLGNALMTFIIVIGYGGGLYLAYENWFGVQAKMRRMKNAEMIPASVIGQE